MIKLGVITDIHANLVALKAVMEQLNQLACDRIICCGDIIGIGPSPEETVQYMMRIPNLTAVLGNHENYLLEGMPTEFPNEENMEAEEIQHHQWEHRQLSAESIAFLKGLPDRIDTAFEGLKVSVLHDAANPTGNSLRKKFADVSGDIILYGHDHRRCIDRRDKWYVNVGSLGCPAQDRNLARAGMVTIVHGTVDVQPVDVTYDADDVIRLIDAIGYPDAENIKKYFYGVWPS